MPESEDDEVQEQPEANLESEGEVQEQPEANLESEDEVQERPEADHQDTGAEESETQETAKPLSKRELRRLLQNLRRRCERCQASVRADTELGRDLCFCGGTLSAPVV